jgi:hypothetical protein
VQVVVTEPTHEKAAVCPAVIMVTRGQVIVPAVTVPELKAEVKFIPPGTASEKRTLKAVSMDVCHATKVWPP